MLTDAMVAELESHLKSKDGQALTDSILAALETMEINLAMQGRKMHHRETFNKIDAARQAVQGAQLAMSLYLGSTRH